MIKGCTTQKNLAIIKGLKENWGEENGYQTEILIPIQNHNMTSLFWVGRSERTAAFGALPGGFSPGSGVPGSRMRLVQRSRVATTFWKRSPKMVSRRQPKRSPSLANALISLRHKPLAKGSRVSKTMLVISFSGCHHFGFA